jgi:hypothetical protein
MMTVVTVVFAVLAVGLLLIPSPTAAGEMSSVDISGRWRINDNLSDDPREVMQQKKQEMRASRGAGGGLEGGRGGRGGGGFGGGKFGGGGSRNQEEMQERFRQLEQGRRDITILQQGDDVTMIYAGGDTITVVADGKKHKRETKAGEVEVRSSWQDLALEVTIKRYEGTEMTRLYRLSNEGRLEVVSLIQLPRGDETIEIVTVYDEIRQE